MSRVVEVVSAPVEDLQGLLHVAHLGLGYLGEDLLSLPHQDLLGNEGVGMLPDPELDDLFGHIARVVLSPVGDEIFAFLLEVHA